MKKLLGGCGGCAVVAILLAVACLILFLVAVVSSYQAYITMLYEALGGGDSAEGVPETIHGEPASGVITATYHDPDYKEQFGVDHEGIDIANARGTNIYCTIDKAEVVNVDNVADYGVFVKLRDKESGWYTLYAHLKDATVDRGDTCEWGDLIGHMNSSGNSTGNHVHYEIRRPDNSQVDPDKSRGCCGAGGSLVERKDLIGRMALMATLLAITFTMKSGGLMIDHTARSKDCCG